MIETHSIMNPSINESMFSTFLSKMESGSLRGGIINLINAAIGGGILVLAHALA